MAERAVTVRLIANVTDYRRNIKQAAQDTQGLSSVTGKAGADVNALGATTAAAGGRMRGALDGVRGSAAGMSSGVKLGAAVAGAAVVAMAKDSVRAASALNEQIAATKTLFGDAADEMLAFGQDASSIGIATTDALQAANAFGDLFTKIGFTTGAAQTFSEDLVRMSADFASFKDMDPAAVLEKLRAGLAGESEPLRQLGVFLTEAKVKAEAMSLGLANATGELDEGAKVAARYSLIMKEMGQAQGDVARTADSYANTQRRFAAETENLRASLGQGLLPVLTDLTTVASKAAGALDNASGSSPGGDERDSWVYSVPLLNHVALALDELAGKSDGAGEASDYLADSQEALAAQESRTARELELTTKQVEEQAKALDALLQATQAQFSSEIAYERAVADIGKSLEDYNTALAANRDSKADNDVSARDLAGQELGLRDALLQAGEAAVQQAEDQAAAAGRTLTEAQKYDLFKEALLKLKAQFPQLGAKVDEYVARLEKAPATVRTELQLAGLTGAKLEIEAFKRAIDSIPSFKNVTIGYSQVAGAAVHRTVPTREEVPA